MSDLPQASRVDRLRPLWIGLSVVLLALAAYETALLFGVINGQQAIGTDLHYYQFVGQRWIDTGVFYTDRQLSGAYQVQTQVDNLYPPHALYLFIPFLVLPNLLWWAIPLGVVGYIVWWCRPVAWIWPILALAVLFPKTPAQVLFGNSDMWITAAIAAGVRWGWPAVLVTIKPSVSFFAMIGIRSRRWWIAAGVLVVASLPFLGLWLDYVVATMNSSAKFWYSFGDLPMFLLPVVAWLGSSRRGDTGFARWAAGLLRGGAATLGSGRR